MKKQIAILSVLLVTFQFAFSQNAIFNSQSLKLKLPNEIIDSITFNKYNTNICMSAINGLIINNQEYILDGRDGLSKALIARGDISNNQSLTLDTSRIHGDKTLSLSANVQSFNEIKIGIGTNQYWSSYFVINNTTATLYNYTNEVVSTNVQFTHGLTIANDISLSIHIDNRGNLSFDLMSDGNTFHGEKNIDDNLSTNIVSSYFLGCNGEPFVTATDASLTNAQLGFSCRGYDADIQIYGDSYIHVLNGKRPYYYLAKNGYTQNVLLNAYPGEGSSQAILDLKRNIQHKIPKYVVWAMGMNDVDPSTSTPNANWLSAVNEMLSICEDNSITPILCTIPSVIGGYSPDSGIGSMRINKAKNDWVKASGYRFIDFANAVGASDIDGTWFNNSLTNDYLESGSMRVHPSQYGAVALYYRLIADFPEITMIKK